MVNYGKIKNLYSKLPSWAKIPLGLITIFIPIQYLYGKGFKKFYNQALKSQYWTRKQIVANQEKLLKKLIEHTYKCRTIKTMADGTKKTYEYDRKYFTIHTAKKYKLPSEDKQQEIRYLYKIGVKKTRLELDYDISPYVLNKILSEKQSDEPSTNNENHIK